jgi:hypothetical protein
MPFRTHRAWPGSFKGLARSTTPGRLTPKPLGSSGDGSAARSFAGPYARASQPAGAVTCGRAERPPMTWSRAGSSCGGSARLRVMPGPGGRLPPRGRQATSGGKLGTAGAGKTLSRVGEPGRRCRWPGASVRERGGTAVDVCVLQIVALGSAGSLMSIALMRWKAPRPKKRPSARRDRPGRPIGPQVFVRRPVEDAAGDR